MIQNRFISFVGIGIILLVASSQINAQEKALVNTSKSPYAKLIPVNIDAVKWTGGFWGHWADVSRDTMAMNMLNLYENDSVCHGFCNFEIAAGLTKMENMSEHPFHDGDFYKTTGSSNFCLRNYQRCQIVQ